MKKTDIVKYIFLFIKLGLFISLTTTLPVFSQNSSGEKLYNETNDFPYFSRVDITSLNDNFKAFNSSEVDELGYYDDRFFLPGFDDIILASVEHNGEKYIGGLFTAFNGEILNGIAKWNGSGWEAVGSTFSAPATRALVYSLQSIDGDLYAAGAFILNETDTHYGVFKLDGSSWLPVGDSFDMNVLTLTEFEGDLYAGGFFTQYNGEFVDRVAKWNGSTWENAGSGLDHAVRDLIVWEDKLVAGGSFTGLTDQEIDETLFTGTYSFEQENEGLFGSVFNGTYQFETELTVDPQNPRYGRILTVDPYAQYGFGLELELRLNFSVSNNSVTFVEDIAPGLSCGVGLVLGPDSDPDESWFDPADDNSFQFSFYENIDLDCGATEPNHHIFTVEKISAAKPATDEVTVLNRIALFDGEEWAAIGEGFNDRVNRLGVHEGNLVAAGNFTMSGENTVNRVAKWNGSSWQQMGAGFNDYATDIISINSALFASGSFTESGESPVGPVVLWNGSAWETAGDGSIPQSTVHRISEFSGNIFAGVGDSAVDTDILETVYLEGDQWERAGTVDVDAMGVKADRIRAVLKVGEEIYVGGEIKRAGVENVHNLAKWSPQGGWEALGSGVGNHILKLIHYDGNIIAGGSFTFTGSGEAMVRGVAYYNGTEWEQLGTGFNGTVFDLFEFDGELYAGGSFSISGSESVNRIAKWEFGWKEVGGGFEGIVYGMAEHSNELYAVGQDLLGNDEIIVKLVDDEWEVLPTTGLPDVLTYARSLVEFNNEIHIVIRSEVNGSNNVYVAMWNGEDEWELLGLPFEGFIHDLQVYNNQLYASGNFYMDNDDYLNGLIFWDGAIWKAIGLGTGSLDNSIAYSMFADEDGLFVAGNFTHANGIPSSNLAKWITDSDGVPVLPGEITLLSPEDGVTDISIQPQFEWAQADGADSYTIQISYENSFNELAYFKSEISGTTFELNESLESLTEYYWRVVGENQNGAGEWSEAWSFTTEMATSIGSDQIPVEFTLRQNYPNPFNPATVIEYGIPQSSEVSLHVYNLLGQRVATLVNEQKTAGWHNVTFDASNLSSGMYIYRIQAGEFVETRKLMLIK